MDTLDNIRECMGAVSVQLPARQDSDQVTKFDRLNYDRLLYIDDSPNSFDTIETNHNSRTPQHPWTERWQSAFSKNHHSPEEQPYGEFMRETGNEGDCLYTFLRDNDSSVPSCEIEEIEDFCKKSLSLNVTSGTATAWLDDRPSFGQKMRNNPKPLTAAELYSHLKSRVRLNLLEANC